MCDYTKTTLVKDIVINPVNINKDINNFILKKCKFIFEGKCTDEGYIKEDSIKILKKSLGSYNGSLFNGATTYIVMFEALLCNPPIGQIINLNIENINKIGIRSFIGPLNIIIAREFETNKKLFKNLKVGDEINIEVIDKQIKKNSKYIKISGKIMSGKNKKNSLSVKKVKMNKENKVIPMSNIEDFPFQNLQNIDIDELVDMDIKKINIGESGLETSNNAEINIVKNNEESDILAFEDLTDKDTMDGNEEVPEFVMNDEDLNTEENTEQETDLDSDVENSETDSDESNSESDNEEENNSDEDDENQSGGAEKKSIKEIKMSNTDLDDFLLIDDEDINL